MALVYKVHIQGGSDNTAPFPQVTTCYCSYLCRDGYGVVLSLPPCMCTS